MCLAKAYVQTAGSEDQGELVLENVARVFIDGDRVRLTTILGQTEEFSARLRSADLVEGRLVLEAQSHD
jgi:predicted RNA-binding protein